MEDPTAKPQVNAAAETAMGGNGVSLSGETMSSLRGIFAYLEHLAAFEERIMTASTYYRGPEQESPVPGLVPDLPAVEATPSTRRELGRQVARTVLAQSDTLHARIESVHLLLVINNWTFARSFWHNLLPDLKVPLLGLCFLRELWGARIDTALPGHRQISSQIDAFSLIEVRIELLLEKKKDITELSDILESHLLPWLSQLRSFLEALLEREFSHPPDACPS